MKLTYTTPNGRLSVQLEADDHRAVFSDLATFQEVFQEDECGKCGSTDVRFVVREVDGNKYHEIHCQKHECRARLAFGQHKQGGTLFPRRKDGDGNWLPDRGWTRWNAKTGQEE